MKIKAIKTFQCSELNTPLSIGAVAEVSQKYGNDVIKAGLAVEAKAKEKAIEVEPKKAAGTMTTKGNTKKK